MQLEIMQCSPKAEVKIKDFEDKVGVELSEHHRSIYPWKSLHIGQCFRMSKAEANISALRANAARLNKQSLKKFAVIIHHEMELVEVARVG